MSKRNCIIFCLCIVHALLIASCASNPVGTAYDPNYIDAQELKLKVRELADQMLATMDNSTLTGLVAMPSSFVDLDNKAQTSSFGNLIGESLIYEFNQRGFPVQEYRLTNSIISTVRQGDLALIRQGIVPTNHNWGALIVGTYHQDSGATFVNARLVRAMDGMVLRTGQLVLVNTPVVNRLIHSNTTSGIYNTGGGLPIVQQTQTNTAPTGPGLYGTEPYYQ